MGGDGRALDGGGGGAPLGIVGFPILLGGSELVGDGDLFNDRFNEAGFKLCIGLLLRVGGAGGGLPRPITLLGPLGRFPKLGGPGGGSFLKLEGLLPAADIPPVGLLLLEGGVGGSPLLGILKPL